MTNQQNKPILAPSKLKLLVTIVKRSKAEFYMDVLQSFEVNMQLRLFARGTASAEELKFLGLEDPEKAVLLGVIKEERAHEALTALETRFKTIKNGKGVAFTIPLKSTIGVAVYKFLCNQK